MNGSKNGKGGQMEGQEKKKQKPTWLDWLMSQVYTGHKEIWIFSLGNVVCAGTMCQKMNTGGGLVCFGKLKAQFSTCCNWSSNF